MQRLRNIFDDLWAALMMFTRLPWWRIYEPEAEHFRNTAAYWPFVGWITGSFTALVFALSIQVFPLSLATLITITSRILLTGALHEDGLADFCDGMGGGTTRKRILEIMKDSHIGTYGVIGLIVYFLFYYFGLRELVIVFLQETLKPETSCKNPIMLMCAALFTMDVWGKSVASFILFLPYARDEETAKTHLVYNPLNLWQIVRVLIAAAPIIAIFLMLDYTPHWVLFVTPIVVEILISLWLRARLKGYTGDCCGAMFLLCEALMLLTWLIVL